MHQPPRHAKTPARWAALALLAATAPNVCAQDAPGCTPNPVFSRHPGSRIHSCDHLQRATLALLQARDSRRPGGAADAVQAEGEYWYSFDELAAGRLPRQQVQRGFEAAVRQSGGQVLHASDATAELHYRVPRSDGDYWGSVACAPAAGAGPGTECSAVVHRVVRVAAAAGAGGVVVLPAPSATAYPTAPPAVEVPLPAGMANPGDDDSSRDPLGLPRLTDYVVSSLSRHTVSDTVPDAQGRPTEQTLGRVETREYKLDRYARGGHATPDAIVRHYRRMLELLGGTATPEGSDGLRGRFLRGGLPVVVTLRVRDGGKRYEVSTGGPGAHPGAPSGTTASVAVLPSPLQPPPVVPMTPVQPVAGAMPAVVDGRPGASAQFRMPSQATVWPPRGTRGMAVLLVGPGVHRATGVRFGTSDAEILARENARLRVRVPVLPEGGVVVTLLEANGSDRLKQVFEVLPAPRADAAVLTVPPCDSRPEDPRGTGVTDLQPRSVRPGQMLKIIGRRLDGVTHVSFTVARHEVDPATTGVKPELIGIDFGAAGQPRSAPRWLDVQAANFGRSYGMLPSVPGQCDAANRTGTAAVKHTADMEMQVCVPPLALSGPIGLWRADGAQGDACETASVPLQVQRSASTPR